MAPNRIPIISEEVFVFQLSRNIAAIMIKLDIITAIIIFILGSVQGFVLSIAILLKSAKGLIHCRRA